MDPRSIPRVQPRTDLGWAYLEPGGERTAPLWYTTCGNKWWIVPEVSWENKNSCSLWWSHHWMVWHWVKQDCFSIVNYFLFVSWSMSIPGSYSRYLIGPSFHTALSHSLTPVYRWFAARQCWASYVFRSKGGACMRPRLPGLVTVGLSPEWAV